MILFRVYFEPFASDLANHVVADLLQINILWGLINLLPIYPLDGGRVARELFTLDASAPRHRSIAVAVDRRGGRDGRLRIDSAVRSSQPSCLVTWLTPITKLYRRMSVIGGDWPVECPRLENRRGA